MFLNIITPCSRPQNLQEISKSIHIPPEQYRWIVVFDSAEIPADVPNNAECYAHQDVNSRSGNAQRNYALDLITTGHVYFNDDDTTLHPFLWGAVNHLTNDFISFKQAWKNRSIRLEGNNISVGNIDSHNFIVDREVVGDTRWVLNRYDADGLFAHDCKNKSKTYLYLPTVLSVYNNLRK
jgi:hypothetical protein